MKKVLIIIALTLFCNISYSDEISNTIAKKTSELISNFVPGEGLTEVNIDLRENHSPDFSILAVRELEKNDNGNFFTQFSLFSTEQNNDERIVGNIGFGKRNLSDDKFMMTGINTFLDYDDAGNARVSLGAEARNVVLHLKSLTCIGQMHLSTHMIGLEKTEMILREQN